MCRCLHYSEPASVRASAGVADHSQTLTCVLELQLTGVLSSVVLQYDFISASIFLRKLQYCNNKTSFQNRYCRKIQILLVNPADIPSLSPAGTQCLGLPPCPPVALIPVGVVAWALAGGPGVQDLVLPQICGKAGHEPDPSESLTDKHFPNAIQNGNVVSICC